MTEHSPPKINRHEDTSTSQPNPSNVAPEATIRHVFQQVVSLVSDTAD